MITERSETFEREMNAVHLLFSPRFFFVSLYNIYIYTHIYTHACCNLSSPSPLSAVSTQTEGEDKIQVLLMVQGRRYVHL